MYDPPFCDSRPRLRAAWAITDINLGPAGGPANFPDQVPGLPGNERVVNIDTPPAISLEGITAGVLNSVGQRDADLTVGVDGVSDDLAALGSEVNGGTVVPNSLGGVNSIESPAQWPS